MKLEKTEKSMAELEISLNKSFEFDKMTEVRVVAQPCLFDRTADRLLFDPGCQRCALRSPAAPTGPTILHLRSALSERRSNVRSDEPWLMNRV